MTCLYGISPEVWITHLLIHRPLHRIRMLLLPMMTTLVNIMTHDRIVRSILQHGFYIPLTRISRSWGRNLFAHTSTSFLAISLSDRDMTRHHIMDSRKWSMLSRKHSFPPSKMKNKEQFSVYEDLRKHSWDEPTVDIPLRKLVVRPASN